MNFKQGMKVRDKHSKEIVGYIAGQFAPQRFDNFWTVILINQNPYDSFRRYGWLWDEHQSWLNNCVSRENPLHTLCNNKWVYNFDGQDLEPCQTKLGNEL